MIVKRNEKGITLIALIVTIIILLILAGVAIVTLTGENGLLKRANKAVEATKEAEAVEVIELQLMSCRMEYTLNSSVDIPTYVEKENKNIETQIDAGNGGDGTPLSNWLMTYGGYEFEIYDLQIQGYYKEGNKVRPTIKDKKVTEEYQFASTSGSKVDVEFKVELPTELTGATVNVNVTSQATGVINGSYDNATGIYTGTIATDGTASTNGTYTYEVKATKDGKDYTVKTTVKVSKFLDNPKIEIPAEDKKWNELKIKVINNYPTDANISYKYYISETETYGTEEFTTDKEITKAGLTKSTQYNIKVEAYLSDKTTMTETIVQETTAEKFTEIRYIEELEAISEDLTDDYKLMNNLDFKERSSYKTDDRYNYYNEDANGDGDPDNSWAPLGASEPGFTGKFFGNYYRIKNLFVKTLNSDNGLFGISRGASFSNLVLEDFNTQFSGGGVIRDCAGLVGDAISCSFDEIGLIGELSNVYTADKHTGLLVGYAHDCFVDKCFAHGSICAYNAYGAKVNDKIGSLMGTIIYSNRITISNSYTDGGPAGFGLSGGENAKLVNSYSVAEADYALGGSARDVTASFWNKEDSKSEKDSVGEEKTKAEMQTQSTYTNAGWDFDTIWEMNSETGYPSLQWEKNIK